VPAEEFRLCADERWQSPRVASWPHPENKKNRRCGDSVGHKSVAKSFCSCVVPESLDIPFLRRSRAAEFKHAVVRLPEYVAAAIGRVQFDSAHRTLGDRSRIPAVLSIEHANRRQIPFALGVNGTSKDHLAPGLRPFNRLVADGDLNGFRARRIRAEATFVLLRRSILSNALFRCAAAAFVLWTSSAPADLLPLVHADFDSAVLQQKRGLDVYLPQESEKNPAQRFETLYVLDGNWNAKLVAQTVDFLHNVGYMPPIIVVGIPNAFDNGIDSRDHDLTPTAVADHARSGGAPDFLRFLKTELIPYVDQRYPTNGFRLVHGHSYGGLFLNYVLASDPSVFGGYVILDPAMWWDDHKAVQQLAEKLPALPTKGTAVFVAGRGGQAWRGMGVDRVQTAFEQHAPAQLPWKVAQYPNESHDSLKFKATYDALRFLFTGFTERGVGVDTPFGIVVKGQPVPLQVDADRFDIRYTTDGSEPNRASAQMPRLMLSDDPTHLRLKSLSTRGEFDQELPLHLTLGEAIAPAPKAKADAPRLFSYAYFESSAWPHLRGKPFAQGRSSDVDMDHVDKAAFAGYLERKYTIPADGYYLFVLGTTERARLIVNGKTLLDLAATDKRVDRPFIVPLRAGVYPVRVEFLRKKGGNLEFEFLRFDPVEGWSGRVE
jgi:predicted alpha/beta superfamily hydrolase